MTAPAGVFTSANSEVEKLQEVLRLLRQAHEALLNTLGASKHRWISAIYRNASAYYYNSLKGKKP